MNRRSNRRLNPSEIERFVAQSEAKIKNLKGQLTHVTQRITGLKRRIERAVTLQKQLQHSIEVEQQWKGRMEAVKLLPKEQDGKLDRNEGEGS